MSFSYNLFVVYNYRELIKYVTMIEMCIFIKRKEHVNDRH